MSVRVVGHLQRHAERHRAAAEVQEVRHRACASRIVDWCKMMTRGNRTAAGVEPKRADEPERDDREPPRRKRRRDEPEPSFAPNINTQVMLQWVPTVLFAAGVLFVIVFTALPIIRRTGSEHSPRTRNDSKSKWPVRSSICSRTSRETNGSNRKRNGSMTKHLKSKPATNVISSEAAARRGKYPHSNVRNVWFEQYSLMLGFIPGGLWLHQLPANQPNVGLLAGHQDCGRRFSY